MANFDGLVANIHVSDFFPEYVKHQASNCGEFKEYIDYDFQDHTAWLATWGYGYGHVSKIENGKRHYYGKIKLEEIDGFQDVPLNEDHESIKEIQASMIMDSMDLGYDDIKETKEIENFVSWFNRKWYVFVNVYYLQSNYGGPEEGGWWYETKHLETHVKVEPKDADQLVQILSKSYNEINTIIEIEPEKGFSEDTRRKYYE